MGLDKVKISLKQIDRTNRDCYNAIASEYDDNSHQTCRDFDFFTMQFIKKSVIASVPIKKHMKYLDVGVGTGTSLNVLMPWLKKQSSHIDVLDISPKMISIVKKKYGENISSFFNTSIHNFKEKISYYFIGAFLCDPFLTIESLKVLSEHLEVGGYLALTLPTNTWSKYVRDDELHLTKFHDKKGKEYHSYSFCWNKSNLIKRLERKGLYLIKANVILLDELQKKKEISDINKNILKKQTNFPFVLGMIFIKRKK